jgi:hypothetical protein
LLLGTAAAQAPVVVELFTSEGCSSCPPADALLTHLSQKQGPNGSQLIVLGEHVDYWNHDGWTDRFSSEQFTKRQQAYADKFGLHGPYTPQMVVDGTVQFVGNDKDRLIKAIVQQSQVPKTATLVMNIENGDTLHVRAQAPGARKPSVHVAITEDGLTTSVAGGENSGRTLHHDAVVRKAWTLEFREGDLDNTMTLALDPQWKRANLKVIAWVQEQGHGHIIGAASLPLSKTAQALPAPVQTSSK